MKELRATVLVGLLAVMSVGLVILGVLNSNRGMGSDKDAYSVHALFDDATGIASGTKVTIAGYPVGEVEDIRLKGALVRVTLRLRQGVHLFGGTRAAEGKELRNAATLTRLQASLLGDYYLELTPGASGEKLGQGDQIPIVVTTTAIQATFDRLETAAKIIPKIDSIAGDVAKVTANAAKVFGGAKGASRFDDISKNLVKTSSDLSKATSTLRKRLERGPLAAGGELDATIIGMKQFADSANLIAGKTGRSMDAATASAMRSLGNVEQVTKSVRELVGRNKAGVESTVGNLRSTLTKLEDTLVRLDRTLATIEKVAGKTAEGQGTIGRLLTDDTLVREAEGAMTKANDLMRRYTGSETAIDFRTAYYAGLSDVEPDAAWRSQLSLRIQPNKSKYYLLHVSSDIYNESLGRRTVTSIDKGPDSELAEQVVESNDNVKFGFQYVRRWGPLALRGGIIESLAGGGVDLFAFNDRLTVGMDIFRLTDPEAPRLRTTLLWFFLPWAYMQFGGDDLLIAERRDLFFGIGMSFTDNDLMMLFLGAPTVQFK